MSPSTASSPGSQTPSSVRALSAHLDFDEHSSPSEDVQLLRSCESCRRKKRKCSGDRPACTRCKAQGECCTYRPTARFLKPRAEGDPLAQHKVPHTKKKRASIASTPLYRMYGSASPAHTAARPRATSVLAALRGGHYHPHHHPFADPIAYAPTDLMYVPSLPTSDVTTLAGPSPQPGLAPASNPNGLAYMSTAATPSGSGSGSLSAFSLCDDEPLTLAAPVSDQHYLYPQCLASSQPAADYSQMLASAITQQQAAAALISAASMGATPMMCSPQQSLATGSPMPDMAAAGSAAAYFSLGAQHLVSLPQWSTTAAAYADPALLGTAMATPAMVAAAIPSMPFPMQSMQSMQSMPVGASDGGAAAAVAAAAGYAGALDAILPQSKTALSEWFAQ
ncbi:hypothetical protein H4R19_003472 [Coemansia spiralis]|nr:hypothetical protein H4R19_003472 [Coemansia spiralis]